MEDTSDGEADGGKLPRRGHFFAARSAKKRRRFRAPIDKNFVDDQAAKPSSWQTPRMARRMAENCPEGATFSQRGLRKSVGSYCILEVATAGEVEAAIVSGVEEAVGDNGGGSESFDDYCPGAGGGEAYGSGAT